MTQLKQFWSLKSNFVSFFGGVGGIKVEKMYVLIHTIKLIK